MYTRSTASQPKTRKIQQQKTMHRILQNCLQITKREKRSQKNYSSPFVDQSLLHWHHHNSNCQCPINNRPLYTHIALFTSFTHGFHNLLIWYLHGDRQHVLALYTNISTLTGSYLSILCNERTISTTLPLSLPMFGHSSTSKSYLHTSPLPQFKMK